MEIKLPLGYIYIWAIEMASCLKTPFIKSGVLNSIPRAHIMEVENELWKLSSDAKNVHV